MKITVVFFSPAIPAQLASSARLAGGGRVIADRLRNWIALGCDVTVLTTTSGMLMLQDSGVDCPMVALEVPHEGWLLRRGKLGVAGVYLLRSVLTRNIARSQGRQDVVRTASPYIHDVLLAMRLRKKSRAVVVFIGHIFPSPLKRSSYSGLLPSLMSWLQQWIVFRLCRKSDVYIVTYAHHVRDLERMGIPADRIRTIELGMELGAKPDVVPQYDCVSIGRVNRMKGFDDLLKVWEEVTRQLPSASLLVIGQVSAEARTILGKSAAKNVQMYGFASEGEKNALLRSSRVFVSTSREEGWGVALSEAIGFGLRGVVYDLKAYSRFDASSVTKVRVGDIEDFGTAIVDLLKKGKSDSVGVQQFKNWAETAREELVILNTIAEQSSASA